VLEHHDRLTLENVDELVQALKSNGLTKAALSLRYPKSLVARGFRIYASPGTAAAIALNQLITAQVDTETDPTQHH